MHKKERSVDPCKHQLNNNIDYFTNSCSSALRIKYTPVS